MELNATERMLMVLQRVRMLRRARGLSQAELAKRLGLSQNAYCRIENGQRELSLTRYIALSHELGVAPHVLLDGDGARTGLRLAEALLKAQVLQHVDPGLPNQTLDP